MRVERLAAVLATRRELVAWHGLYVPATHTYEVCVSVHVLVLL